MTLSAQTPHQELPDPFEMMARSVGTLSRFFTGGLFPMMSGVGQTMQTLVVDMREDAQHLYIDADLPGFRKEDINVSLQNSTLLIRAERREQAPQQEQQAQQSEGQPGQPGLGFLMHERRYQHIERAIGIPIPIDENSIQAKLDNGVLRLTLTKRQEPKHIEVS